MVNHLDLRERKIEFIQNKLVGLILNSNDEMKNHRLISANIELASELDGFMSAILVLDIVTESSDKKSHHHPMIVKLMKGDYDFRVGSKGYPQFENEITVYSKIIPTFKDVLVKSGAKIINYEEWIPKVYFADHGSYPELSDYPESILAVENLKYKNFRMGPRLDLNEQHFKFILKTIAEFHSLSYAMRIKKDPRLDELIKLIKPLPFQNSDGTKNLYDINYEAGLKRFFQYYDRSPEHQIEPFATYAEHFRKYREKPLLLMEQFLRDDPKYSVLTHGDYNRNNVLFQYKQENGFENPTGLRMIDFQEIRYGTPMIDLSFILFLNMNPDDYEKNWDKYFHDYHDHLINCLCEILHVEKNHPCLVDYSFENFYNHCKQFAFYGVMIAIHFVPWMVAPPEDSNMLGLLFEKDMLSPEFTNFAMIIGGEPSNFRFMRNFQHAVINGYAEILKK